MSNPMSETERCAHRYDNESECLATPELHCVEATWNEDTVARMLRYKTILDEVEG